MNPDADAALRKALTLAYYTPFDHDAAGFYRTAVGALGSALQLGDWEMVARWHVMIGLRTGHRLWERDGLVWSPPADLY